MCCKHCPFANTTVNTCFNLCRLSNWLEPFSPLGAWRQSARLYTFDCTQWIDIHVFVYLIKFYCVHHTVFGLRSTLHWRTACRHLWSVCDYVVYVCVWLWNLFKWWLSSVWLRCVLCVCVCVCVLLSLRGVGCVFVQSSGGLWWFVQACVLNQRCCLSDIFVRVPFEKVEHIIHRQGHMLSSRPPLLHPHNARCHAHSCQLVPACLPMPVTASQFTFSTHSSRVLCPRCGHMQATWGEKNKKGTELFPSILTCTCVCWQASTAALAESCVRITICLHRRPPV